MKNLETLVNEDLGIVELYSGLAGMRQALNLTNVQPGVHVMSDVNNSTGRAAGMAWPKGIRWGDIKEIDKAKVQTLLTVGLKVKLWMVGGGFPCLEYTALKAEREG